MNSRCLTLAVAFGLCLGWGFAACAQPYVISTLAGQPGLRFADGTNSGALFDLPSGIAKDGAGNLYVPDLFDNVIRKMTPVGSNLVVTTIAGTPGTTGSRDGTNGVAQFSAPWGIATDSATNLYVTDSGNNTIRKITPTGTNWIVTTYAGIAGFPLMGRDGYGPGATFFQPQGIAADRAGNLYIADQGDEAIRIITPGGTYGNVKTIAGPGPNQFGAVGSADGTNNFARFRTPSGIAIDSASRLYVTDQGNSTIRMINPVVVQQGPMHSTNWVVTTITGQVGNFGSGDGTNDNALFDRPYDVTVDSATNLYVIDTANYTIREVSPQGTNWIVSTMAGTAGVAGIADGTNSAIQFKTCYGILADSGTNLYVADTWDGTIREVSPSGTNWMSTTVAGMPGLRSADGAGTNAHFYRPAGAAVDRFGNLYVADFGNSTIRMLVWGGTNWVSTTLAGIGGAIGSADGTNGNAQFHFPIDLALDAGGTIYVADQFNYTIRRIASTGTDWVVTTLAGTPGVRGKADGTNASARFAFPWGIAVDSATNIYVADSNNNAIRKLTQAGADWVVSTLAGGTFGKADGTNNSAQFGSPEGIALDSLGNLYVVDTFNCAIRKVSPIGTNWVVTTIAGGSVGSADGMNNNAKFYYPSGIAVDSVGNLFVADYMNALLRKITPVGTNWVVTTIAGLAGATGTFDGTGSAARFIYAASVAVDAADNIYVPDAGADTIRFGQAAAWLQTTLSNNQLILSWPLAASNHVLQTSSNLSPGALWTPITNGITLSGLSFVLTNTAAAPAAFYRLQPNDTCLDGTAAIPAPFLTSPASILPPPNFLSGREQKGTAASSKGDRCFARAKMVLPRFLKSVEH